MIVRLDEMAPKDPQLSIEIDGRPVMYREDLDIGEKSNYVVTIKYSGHRIQSPLQLTQEDFPFQKTIWIPKEDHPELRLEKNIYVSIWIGTADAGFASDHAYMHHNGLDASPPMTDSMIQGPM